MFRQLYGAGARNFLFLNVPPIDRAPFALDLNDSQRYELAGYIGAFNFRLGAMIYNLAIRCHDTTVFSFDTNSLFLSVLEHPAQFMETAGYRNVTDFCPFYME